MYWGLSLIKEQKGKQKVSTGISPSGPIHLGNLREILTGDIIYKSLVISEKDASFIYLCDDIDPLRKVYPFLPQSYSVHVGKPLRDIPAPEGDLSYSEYFLRPFLKSIETLDVKPEVIRTGQLYAEGKFGDIIDLMIKKREEIRNIIQDISGRELEDNWFPYNPKCSKCGRINSATAYDYSDGFVYYRCSCGNEGKSDIYKDEGKLPWRLEWPAKWKILGVTIEPFGKDHGTQGGSYDTGKAISEAILNYPAPLPQMFERILLKGKGAMHSSTGVNIPATEILDFAPPEIVRYMMARVPPSRHIEFDPEVGFLNLMDEFERLIKLSKDNKLDEDQKTLLHISSTENALDDLPDYRHLTTLVQIYSKDEQIKNVLARSGKTYPDELLERRIKQARYWVNHYAPESSKFQVSGETDQVNMSETEKEVICSFLKNINSMDEWKADLIHEAARNAIEKSGLSPSEGFVALYKALIGKERGPRIGFFLESMEKNRVKGRLSFICGVKNE
ncbi:lysine--tRNA ligase [Cuniculiplasma sp. SKW3]|uniref:lysine--tRNA ligase n=1 Tax=unclassified Cuniculiplasma TaxID=2619706 RepID=UPI003FD2A04C